MGPREGDMFLGEKEGDIYQHITTPRSLFPISKREGGPVFLGLAWGKEKSGVLFM